MTAPLISVIISNYNYGCYLSQAIDSVLGQSYPNVEVIVVDDGSTDDSEAVLWKYGEEVRWFQQCNQGVSAARNRGIHESRGELVAFLDADDMWRPEKLARQVELLSRNPGVGMAYCGVQYIDASGQLHGINVSRQCGWMLKEIALLRWTTEGSSPLVWKKCFDRAGLFDVELSTSADWDMWRRIACYYEIGVVREPLVLYRLHHSSMHRNVDVFERDTLRAFLKMFDDPAAAEIHPFRRRCYGKLYLTLAGSYLHVNRWDKSLKYAVRSILAWPPSLGYLALYPARRIRRRFHIRTGDLEPIP